MSVDTSTIERPRKLVVIFSGYSASSHEAGTIPTDLQLIHNPRLPWIEKLSRFDRLVHRLKLKKEKKSQIDEPVAEAYTFVSRNYKSGDQVIFVANDSEGTHKANLWRHRLIVDTILPRDETSLLEAAEILASHLNNGTRPRHLLETELGAGSEFSDRRVPIHGVIVDSSYSTESISQLNDRLKSRFSRGVEHIVCVNKDHSYSCSTIANPNGHIIAREMCFYSDGLWPRTFTYSTRNALYYAPDKILEWQQQDPVWTHTISSLPPSVTEGIVPLELTVPAGMHRHELKRYHDPERLVWTSSRR